MVEVRQLVCLRDHFVPRSKPFRRPKDLTHFAHGVVGKLVPRTTRLCACRLALSKMASNLEHIIDGFGPYVKML
jgi:hypothetical protein